MSKLGFMRRPYKTYINLVYYAMYGTQDREILAAFRQNPSATTGKVAGISKSGHIIMEVFIDGKVEQQLYDAEMLD